MKLAVCKPLGAIFLSAVCVTVSATVSGTGTPAASAAGPGMLVSAWNSATDLQAWHGAGLWRWNLSPFSIHFRHSAEHKTVWAFGAERQRPDGWLAGASYFRNSFGQPSAYLYVGKRFPSLFGHAQLYGQASAGLLYGYRGKFQNKVPLNVNGFSPGALVGVGWQFNKTSSATLHMLGDAGLMLQLSYDLR